MKVMDTLSDVYREVCLLRLKYEHLMDVCKTLLKPWPNYDASGRPIKDAGKGGETTTTEEQKKGLSLGCTKNEPGDQKKGDAPAKLPHEEDEEQQSSTSTAAEELQLLDEILSRAQKLRAVQPSEDGVSTRKSSFAARSAKLAASVYKPRDPPGTGLTGKRQKASQSKLSTTTRSKQPSSSTSRGAVGSSQRTAKTAGMSTTSRSLCSQAKRSETKKLKAKSLPELPQFVPTQSQKQFPFGMSDIRSENEDVACTGHEADCPLDQQAKSLTKIALHDEHEESCSELLQGKSDRFTLRLHGTRLAMPSKYHRLHNALAKLNENFGSQAAESQCSAAAEHFSQRLVPKETACCAKAIQLQLVQEGFSLLKEQVTSITPQEWAVSDRSSWQEVLRIKSKLDFITEQTHRLQQELKEVLSIPSPPPPPPSPPSGPEQGATSHTRPLAAEIEPVEPFVYSSLKDWHAMAKVAHYRQLYAWEAEMLSFCEQIILPRATNMKHTDRSFSAVLQSVYEILGMDTKPLFLSVEPPPSHQQLQLEPN